jgi:hypothetical protein
MAPRSRGKAININLTRSRFFTFTSPFPAHIEPCGQSSTKGTASPPLRLYYSIESKRMQNVRRTFGQRQIVPSSC